MASMQLRDIREMGEAMTRAREFCLEAQYEKGMALYQTTLQRLSQFIRRITKMSERQPWLQMQIELENELNLITDYVELTQAFKVPPGAAIARIHPQAPRQEESASPRWEICAPPDPRRLDPSANDARDPDVWAPPSPEKVPNRFRGGAPPGAAAPAHSTPSWANDNNGNNNQRNNRMARKPAAPSGRRTPGDDKRRQAPRTPGDDQRRQAPRRGGAKASPGPSPARQKNKDGGLKAARKENERARERGGGGGSEKPKYSEMAKEEGWVDLELIEMIERDIVDSAAAVSFEQIAGLEHTKQLLQEAVMLPQIAPHLFKDGLLKPCNGVLMFGPPGTGKTLLAKAVANVCKSTFFNVSASTLASKYRGESERMVRILFDMARYYSPSIIFMDEIDAIAGARGGAQEHESSRRVKTELLVQINGVSSGDPADPGNRVMVLAATNLPWELDEAMRRRLTKRVYIPLPEAEGRLQLFKINLEKVDVAFDVNFDKLVAATEGYSGDDICGLCDTAKMMPVKRLYTPEVLKELQRKQQEGASDEDLQAHEKNALEVTWTDFQTALENVSKSVGQDQLERFVKWEEEFGSK
ncbi:Katanin p60 ATPase-containing subunit A1 [Phytophthora pseudosyringae]|uniref:Katanin p60 ATPase-containing subunit A1 n=1 Tax=Phytophthora pseudosyringae TaxID=221518 RepID=A0A8T1WAB0_9STRA|nr:Katanin p60 ATPase-containing subunit A1 [Phytophthora pseudosyringae]